MPGRCAFARMRRFERDDHNRHACASQHAFRDGSQKELWQSAFAVASHDDEIGALFFRSLDDLLHGAAVP